MPRPFGGKDNEEPAVRCALFRRRALFRRASRVPDERLVVCAACRREVGLRADGTLRNHPGTPEGYGPRASRLDEILCPESGKPPDARAADRWLTMARNSGAR